MLSATQVSGNKPDLQRDHNQVQCYHFYLCLLLTVSHTRASFRLCGLPARLFTNLRVCMTGVANSRTWVFVINSNKVQPAVAQESNTLTMRNSKEPFSLVSTVDSIVHKGILSISILYIHSVYYIEITGTTDKILNSPYVFCPSTTRRQTLGSLRLSGLSIGHGSPSRAIASNLPTLFAPTLSAPVPGLTITHKFIWDRFL